MWCDLWLTSANPLQIPLSFLLHSNDPALHPQPCASWKAKYHSIKPADGSRESFTDDTVLCMNCWTTQKKFWFMPEFIYEGSYVFVCLCAWVNLHTHTWQCVPFYILIDFHLIAIISIILHVFLYRSLPEFTIMNSGWRTNNLKLIFKKKVGIKMGCLQHRSHIIYIIFVTIHHHQSTQSHPPHINQTSYSCFHVIMCFLTCLLYLNFQDVIFLHLPMCSLSTPLWFKPLSFNWDGNYIWGLIVKAPNEMHIVRS